MRITLPRESRTERGQSLKHEHIECRVARMRLLSSSAFVLGSSRACTLLTFTISTSLSMFKATISHYSRVFFIHALETGYDQIEQDPCSHSKVVLKALRNCDYGREIGLSQLAEREVQATRLCYDCVSSKPFAAPFRASEIGLVCRL